MKIYFLILALGVAGFLRADTPEVKIPRIPMEVAQKLAEATAFVPEDWAEAATIRNFSNVPLGYGALPEPTAFYLQHDGVTLWVAVRCAESDLAHARAFERAPEDDLTLDESVQVVLGTDDGRGAVKLHMGGYAGAFSDQGPCAYFYEMTGNMVNAVSRRYNETPLPNPRFDFRAFPDQDGWTAIFAIPFESAGIDFHTRRAIYLNAFRFYRGIRYGWHLPAFGGYAALPFGRAELLDFADNRKRTTEVAVPVRKREIAKPVFAPGRLAMEYYPASAEIAAEIPAGTHGDVVLTVNGQSVTATGKEHWPVRLIAPAEAPEGTRLIAELKRDDEVLLRREYTAKARGSWRHDVAREYREERTPYPWRTPVFHDGEVELAHGKVEFGDGVLPNRIITSRETELLQGPVELVAEVGGRRLRVNPREEVKTSGTAVEMLSRHEAGLEVKTRVEYDGFMAIRARLGADEPELERLSLRIPLAPGVAQYVNTGNSQQLFKVNGFGYHGDSSGMLWVGNANGGIIFSYDNPLFCAPRNGEQIELDGDDLVIHFVAPGGVTPPKDMVFEFFLQFTPFRDDVIPLLDADMWFESWSDYQSYPDMSKVPQITERVEQSKAKGRDFYLYFGQTLAENAPEYAAYRSDFMAEPHRPWYQRAYDPGKGVPSSVICFRAEAGEFMLDRIDQLAEKTGLRHLYLDGPSVPFSCDNLNHKCAAYLPAEWDADWHEGELAGQRSYLKRLRGIFDARKIKYPLWHHTGGGYQLMTFALCDFYWDGEQLSRYKTGYLLEPDRFAMVYAGCPFGFQGVFLPVFYVDATLTTRQALAWTVPHGILNAVGEGTSFEDYFGIVKRHPGARFFPYTAEQPHIRNLKPNTLNTSYYLADNEALLSSGNVVYHGTQTAEIDLSGLFPGRQLEIRCLNRDEIPDYQNGILRFSVAERDLRIWHIAPAGTDVGAFHLPNPQRETGETLPVVPLPAQSSFQAERWLVEAGEFAPIPDSGLPFGLRASSGSARLRYRDALPDHIKMSLRFRHSGKFKIIVDGLEVTFDYHSAKGWYIENMDKSDSLDRSDVTLAAHGRSYSAVGKTLPLEIFLIDGRVSVWYDGVRILQHGLPAKYYPEGHSIALETGDGEWIAWDVTALGPAQAEDMPAMIHPVR